MRWLNINGGALVWLVLCTWIMPESAFKTAYVHCILLAAVLWLVPLGWRMLKLPEMTIRVGQLSGLLLAFAYMLEPSTLTGLFALPWLLFAIWVAGRQLRDWSSLKLHRLCELGAVVFLTVGAAWVCFDRWGYYPMRYDPIIVLLTGIHFHYAGFILPLATARVLPHIVAKIRPLLGWGILLGMPLVALGITSDHLGFPPLLEAIPVTIMTLAGSGVALAHLNLGWKKRTEPVGILWLIGGLALLAGMLLATLYGWRAFLDLPFLSIPWMYAVHGTLNAMGFAVPILLGWWLSDRSAPPASTIFNL